MSHARYSTADVLQVQNYSAAGWSQREIRRVLLRDHGHAPSVETICKWINPAYAEQARARTRASEGQARAEHGYTFRLAPAGRDTKYLHRAFALRLRAEGEPIQGIARVCQVVFGGQWTADRVRKLIAESAA